MSPLIDLLAWVSQHKFSHFLKKLTITSIIGTSSSNYAFVLISSSSMIKVTNISFASSTFFMSRAISILSSFLIEIRNLTISDSDADYNNLIYLSETKDLTIAKFVMNNIHKT